MSSLNRRLFRHLLFAPHHRRLRLKIRTRRSIPLVPVKPDLPTSELAKARQSFQTKLRVRGPAPQAFEIDRVPTGVKEVINSSGDLKLKGWLSADTEHGRKLPAVVFLHGGYAFGAEDWNDASPLCQSGFQDPLDIGHPATIRRVAREMSARYECRSR